ncbi:MAG TPA: peptidase C39 [Trinickia sp.]|jgi:hypothetical protein|nr:peptidase C39 [Trinickia sp.]
MKSPLRSLRLALAIATGALAADAGAAEVIAHAAPEFPSASEASTQTTLWQPVSDDELAKQTGKYAGSSMISGMVLNLVSQWRLPNGASASAQAALVMKTNANHSLRAYVRTSAQVSDAVQGKGNAMGKGAGQGANPQASATGGQNVSVNGVSQVTQVAGDNNVGVNSAVIDFNGAQAQPLAGANAPSASATNAAGTVKASVAFGNGGVSLALQTPAGVATQTVMPGNAQQPGAIAQLVQIAGNAQAASNQLQLSLLTKPMSGALLREIGAVQAMRDAAYMRR